MKGNCNGKGICSACAQGDQGASPDAIAVTFNYIDQKTVSITFSINDLQQTQPDEANYFADPSGTYVFDGAFPIGACSLFSSWNLAQNASISPNSYSSVSIDANGIVTDVVSIDYNYGNRRSNLASQSNTVANLSVFPNPATSVLNFSFPPAASAFVKLTDLTGKIAGQQSVANASTIVFNVAGLPKGIYFYQLNTDGEISTGKVVIE